MAAEQGNVWLQGTRIYIRRPDASLWSMEGIDDGPASEPVGSVWPEHNLLVYVDVNGRRRVLQLIDRGSTFRPPNSIYIDPDEWLWISKAGGVDNRKMAVFHGDHSDGSHGDYSDYT